MGFKALLNKDILLFKRNKREVIWFILLPLLVFLLNFYMSGRVPEINLALIDAKEEQQLFWHDVGTQMSSQVKLNLFTSNDVEGMVAYLEQGVVDAYLVWADDVVYATYNASSMGGIIAQGLVESAWVVYNNDLARLKLETEGVDPHQYLNLVPLITTLKQQGLPSMTLQLYGTILILMAIINGMRAGYQVIIDEKTSQALITLKSSPIYANIIIFAKLGTSWLLTLMPFVFILTLAAVLGHLQQFLTLRLSFFALLVVFNSTAIGLLIGALSRTHSEAASISFGVSLPALLLSALPQNLPPYMEQLVSLVPPWLGAQVLRQLVMGVSLALYWPSIYLVATGLFFLYFAALLIRRETTV